MRRKVALGSLLLISLDAVLVAFFFSFVIDVSLDSFETIKEAHLL